MKRFGRKGQLAMLPDWISSKLDVHLLETDRLLELAQAETPQGSRVLDAGSGEGQYRHYFEHTHYTGVDLAVGDVQWDYSGLDTQADLSRMPFAAGSFDAAVCFQVLEHVNEPARVINEVGRVLRPGGRFYLSAPMAWHQHQKPHDFFRYTSYGFTYLLENAGMRVVEMRPWGGYFWFLSYNFQMMHDRLFPRGDNDLAYLMKLPVILPVYLIFFILLPLLLFYLDRLDKVKDHTLGWACIAEKLPTDEHGPTPV
jgi:SAM-dependent methyltransferase